jgi:hypothetical protein
MLNSSKYSKEFLFILIILALISQACATESKTQGMRDYSEGSEASGHAYVTDAMTIRGPMPYREPKWKPIDFYYKKCEETGPRHPWTATYYECTMP